MRKKTLKAVTLAAVAGMVFQFGGCLNVRSLVQQGLTWAAFEWVADNDAVFDLFEGGA